ncbi:FGGY-family carbohydrate kinase [Treponema sp. OMZ 840]|uniref:gluconokinase n=1 Tax=Treponema sp. OMZ 840 TaxID=244313 RepID=UPI003D8ADB91
MEILVLEASTSSAKAMLYHTADNSFEIACQAYDKNCGNGAVQNAEAVYESMISAGKKLLSGRHVDIITLCGVWHSVMLCRKDMKPASPVYQWTYGGAKELCSKLRSDKDYPNTYYQKTGCMVNAVYPFFKLLLMKEQGINLSEYYIHGQGSYNTYRMTHKRVLTDCMASGSGLLNIHTKNFDTDLLTELGVSAEQFGNLTQYNSIHPLCKEAAAALGVKEGIPVISANPDGGLNQAGEGALRKGVMTFSVGTSGAIRLSTAQPALPDKPSTWCYLSLKNWLSGAATNGCGICIDWFYNQVNKKVLSYTELEQNTGITEHSPAFLPFIFGERCPGWNDERKGGFAGLAPDHGLQDMYLAVQEGVLFNLYQCYRILTDLNGSPEHIRLSGGILHSEKWTQMCADIFNHEMEIGYSEHGSLLGGAVVAMEALGILDDVQNYRPDIRHKVQPDEKKRALYEKRFQRYEALYNTGF